MNRTAVLAAAATVAVTLGSCASSAPSDSIDYDDNYRFAGSMRGVRVDAQLVGTPGRMPFRVVYEVENGRDHDIAFVASSSIATYNQLERTITLSLGAEIPEGEEMVLERVRAGERRRFTTIAHASQGALANPSAARAARFVRLRLTWLTQLDGLGIESSDPRRESIRVADSALPDWLERNESLVTNVLPFVARTVARGSSAEGRTPVRFHPPTGARFSE